LPERAEELVKAARSFRIVAMGGSYNASCAAVEAFLSRGFDARAELASHLLHTPAEPIAADELVIFVSHSGTSVETIRAAERLRDAGHTAMMCITNALGSPLAEIFDVLIDQELDGETHVPFGPWVSTYFTLYKMALLRAGDNEPDWASATEAAKAILDSLAQVAALAPTAPPYVELFGRGVFRATAEQGTLIVREIARVAASAWDPSTYRHGPIEAILPTQLCVVFAASEGRAAQLDASFVASLREITDDVIVIGPDWAEVPVGTSDELSALVSILAVAVISYAWGEAAGIPIGQFRYTSHSVTDEDALVVEA
jgi:glucosamine--fructose-6-phosphate aminotransferase (isomerizing)